MQCKRLVTLVISEPRRHGVAQGIPIQSPLANQRGKRGKLAARPHCAITRPRQSLTCNNSRARGAGGAWRPRLSRGAGLTLRPLGARLALRPLGAGRAGVFGVKRAGAVETISSEQFLKDCA